MHHYFNPPRRNMEEDLNLFCKWKTTCFLSKWKETLFFFKLMMTLFFVKWKMTSFFWKMEDGLIFLENGRRPQFFGRCQKTSFLIICTLPGEIVGYFILNVSNIYQIQKALQTLIQISLIQDITKQDNSRTSDAVVQTLASLTSSYKL